MLTGRELKVVIPTLIVASIGIYFVQFSNQSPTDALKAFSGSNTEKPLRMEDLSPAYIQAIQHEGFSIVINDQFYTQSRNVSPAFPIMATFFHSDPNITKIRMQHPGDSSRSLTFPLDKAIRITNHEGHMAQGHVSTSEFVALDGSGKAHGRIILKFVPKKR